VKVFNGPSNHVLRSFFPYPGFTGAVRVGTEDVNGDGKADIITGVGPGAGPHVKVFDGVTLAVLESFLAFGSTYSDGIFVGG
jgi:serralysin